MGDTEDSASNPMRFVANSIRAPMAHVVTAAALLCFSACPRAPSNPEVDSTVPPDTGPRRPSCGDSRGLQAAAPWPMYRRCPNHVGFSELAGAVTEDVLWRFVAGGAIGSAVAIDADGVLYFGSADRHVYAVNGDGTLRWTFPTGGAVSSTPAVGADGTIYVGSSDGILYAIQPDGSSRWELETAGDGIQASPGVGPDGTVYVVANRGGLYAVRADGSVAWHLGVTAVSGSSPALGPQGDIYLGRTDMLLQAVHPDGTERWTAEVTWRMDYSSPVVSADGTIYAAAGNRLHAFDPDGQQLWEYVLFADFASPTSIPAIGLDGTLYVGSVSSGLYAVHPDGTERWVYDTGSDRVGVPTVDREGAVYVGTTGGLLALDAAGDLRWELRIEGGVGLVAIGSGGMVYAGAECYKIYAIGAPGAGDPSGDPRPLAGACGLEGDRVFCNEDPDCDHYCAVLNTCTLSGDCWHSQPGMVHCLGAPGDPCLAPGEVCNHHGMCQAPCTTHDDCPGGVCQCQGGAEVCAYFRCQDGACPSGTTPEPASLACLVDASALEGDCHNISGTCDASYVQISERGCVIP